VPQNLASLVITREQQAAALAAIVQVSNLLDGLVTLDPAERRRLPMMGPKSDRFARGIIRLLEQNAQLVPPGVDLPGATADLAALDQLMPILDALQQLTTRVDHTVAALGSDVMDVAQTGYGVLKMLGNEYGLEDVRKELGYRWARSSKKAPGAAG
jgi:hypothetical protein